MNTERITAEEARNMAEVYSNMDDMLRDIEQAAIDGQFNKRFIRIVDKDVAKLEKLGFEVEVDKEEKFPYNVVW